MHARWMVCFLNLLVCDVAYIPPWYNYIDAYILSLAYAHFGTQQGALSGHHLKCMTLSTLMGFDIVFAFLIMILAFFTVCTCDDLCKSQKNCGCVWVLSVFFASRAHNVILIHSYDHPVCLIYFHYSTLHSWAGMPVISFKRETLSIPSWTLVIVTQWHITVVT